VHPDIKRVAAVFGRSQGSGYLLTPWVVLTAAHLVEGASEITVVTWGGPGAVRCRLLWKQNSRDCDVALLAAERELLPGLQPPEIGVIYDVGGREGAQALGFPQVQRNAGGDIECEQLIGTLKPGSGALSGLQVLDSGYGAPASDVRAASPWAGMSGAAVFFDDLLVGVVKEEPAGWRHARVGLTPTRTLMANAAFHMACKGFGIPINRAAVPTHITGSQSFEQRLRSYVKARNRELTVIGLSQSGAEAESWPMDASYLSLELLEAADPPPGDALPGAGATAQPVRQRAEQALAGHTRIVIRGAAGSGKTTLLQWLASMSAARDLPATLEEWNDCFPMLLRLRALVRNGETHLPSPEEFLAVTARSLAGQPGASGWVTRQLEAGRLLLLVDGVDEVPERDRSRTRDWLEELLTAYPAARCVVTTRPSAIREGWLSRCGFTELELQPMSRADVLAFIGKWHVATRTSAEWQSALSAAVVTKPDLGRLATNPLMCALICALNRDRRGFLPSSRMELYAAGLEMLLVRRDRERGVATGLMLTLEQQVRILQKLAYWLTLNGATEMTLERAEKIVAETLPAMLSVTAPPSDVLRHLVQRSGLLRQPTTDTIDFVHRTFQDYLGARAAIENEDLGVLVRNAHDDQWEDVLRMATGHARPRERAALLRQLLDRAAEDALHRDRIHLVAAACLENATELDPSVREDVVDHMARLIPPRDAEQGKALAVGGAPVLSMLPGPLGLDDDSALGVVHAATAIGGDAAIPLLSQYASHPSIHVRSQLVRSWERFGARAYAGAVLSRLTYDDDLRFIATSPEQLVLLGDLGGRPRIECSGPFSQGDLGLLPTAGLVELRLHENPNPVDLNLVTAARELRSLWISNCPGEIDLRPLVGSSIRSLSLNGECRLTSVASIAQASSLEVLDCLHAIIEGGPPRNRLPVPPGLRALLMGPGAFSGAALHGLDRCTRLQRLAFDAKSVSAWRRPELGRLTQLTTLSIAHDDLNLITATLPGPLPSVENLELFEPGGLASLSKLASTYPRLKRLTIDWARRPTEPFDVDALAPLHGCRVDLYNPGSVTARQIPLTEPLPLATGGVSYRIRIP
jgi:hypothetical protein